MLFIVVFIMFMLVDVSASYLTRRAYNPQADVPVLVTSGDVFSEQVLAENAGENPQTFVSLAVAAEDNPYVAIVVDDAQSSTAAVMREWCVYSKYRFRVFTSLPSAADVADCIAILFGDSVVDASSYETLLSYTETDAELIFTSLPDYGTLQANEALADFFGISGFVTEQYALDGVYLFDEFFVNGERIYTINDDYGDSDDDVRLVIPYYQLRPGYLMFAQAISPDKSVDYKDLPGLLWRTSTNGANVYVVNTDIFSGKNLLGLLTAFMSQSDTYYVYPVVNAQSISLVDFPMLSNENANTLSGIYSRDAEALGRDVLWPGVAKILRNYKGSYNFFMATQMNYTDSIEPSDEFIAFYRQEIERLSGALGLSLNQLTDAALSDIIEQNNRFLTQAMPEYRFTAAYMTPAQLQQLITASFPALLNDITLFMTDEQDAAPLLGFINDRALSVAFTTDGFIHESMDDLHLVCIETALGMNNQKVEMSKAFYPDDGTDWNALNLLWSRGDTYQKPYKAFSDVSVYGLEARVRTFLALDYSAQLEDHVLTLSVTNPSDAESSFILRLHNQLIDKVEGAKCTKLSDTAYLITTGEASVTVHLKDMHVITDAPTTTQEVIKP